MKRPAIRFTIIGRLLRQPIPISETTAGRSNLSQRLKATIVRVIVAKGKGRYNFSQLRWLRYAPKRVNICYQIYSHYPRKRF